MTVQDRNDPEISRDLIVDRIYEIALEPASLDDFIDFWHDTNLEAHFSDASEHAGTPDQAYKAHLERAETIMQRGDAAHPDLSEYLNPYENLAAFVVSGSLRIEALNTGAEAAFGVHKGDALDQLGIPSEVRVALLQAAQDVLHNSKQPEKLLKADMASKGGTMLFRLVRLTTVFEDGPIVLIVSTQFHWRDSIATLLGNVFQVTKAEQDVIRLLVEGLDAKSIATSRNTSEGTVRGQIKSITAKMNVRSQTDIVRLVMTLGEFPKGLTGQDPVTKPHALSNNWLEAEVWKPFKSLTMPDGRTLTYHEMGPPTGNPVLYSHTGSCLARWPRSMLRHVFERNLRIICPIRAGYGHSDGLPATADPIETATDDTLYLLNALRIAKLPYVGHGTDLPFAAHLISQHPDVVTKLIGIGAFPRKPGDQSVVCAGRWQRFFVTTARNAPHLVQFAAKAVMAMTKRIGPDAMLRQLCKDQPSDLALLEDSEMKQVLAANISLMAGKSTNSARAFAMEFIAFQNDWSAQMQATHQIPSQFFLAEEDPTIDLGALPDLQTVYPWISFEILPKAGLAMIFQHYETLIPIMAEAAKNTS
ncbi:MAG: LuxR C-terminal-related transcriptional regulator [Paracoccaceae bacterium]